MSLLSTQLVYDAENDWWNSLRLLPQLPGAYFPPCAVTPDAVQAYCTQLLLRDGFEPLRARVDDIEVSWLGPGGWWRDNDGVAADCRLVKKKRRGIIRIARQGVTRAHVLHELAHLAAWKRAADSAHDADFRGMLVHFVAHAIGPDHGRSLCAAFQKHNLLVTRVA